MNVFCFWQDEKFAVTLFALLLFNAITMQPSQSLSLEEVHLVRCLTYISHRYFTEARSLVISSPSTYRDVKQELIAEIHRTAFWPVVNVDGNIRKPDKSDITDKYVFFIMLIQDGNVEGFLAENAGLFFVRDKLTRIWNYDARFVVAGAKKFSMSQQKRIFNAFSELRIYNCIIVSLEHDVIRTEYSRQETFNEVDTGMKLAVYSWFPYQSSDRCDNVVDIIILDSWVIYGQGHFTKNTDFFPRKIDNSFNGCPMKAFVRNCDSFFTTMVTYGMDSNGNTLTHMYGLEMKLLDLALKHLNMTFYLAAIDGGEVLGPTYEDIFRMMIAKNIYIFLGCQGNHH
jgi:hypothetical protein